MNREEDVLIYSSDEHNDSGAIEITDPIEEQESPRPEGELVDARERLNQRDQVQAGNAYLKRPRFHPERSQYSKIRPKESKEHRQNENRDPRSSGPNPQRFRNNNGRPPLEWNQGQHKSSRNRRRGNAADKNESFIVADDQRELINSLRRINDLNEDTKLLQKKHERTQLELSEAKNKAILLQKRVEELELQSKQDTARILDFEKKSITRTISPLAEQPEERNKMINSEDKQKERLIRTLKAKVDRLKKETDNDQAQLKNFREKKLAAEEALDNFQAGCCCKRNDSEAQMNLSS